MNADMGNIGRIILDAIFDNPMDRVDALVEQARELAEKHKAINQMKTADAEGDDNQ